MSECVVRMEMPGSCLECPFFNKVGCKASGMMFPDWMNVAVRPKGCPILSVLPEKHGRLVDADEIVKRICSDCAMLIDAMCDGGRTSCYPASFVYEQETIIPATEGGKHDHR